MPGFDGASAKQYLVFPFSQAPDHHLGVFIMDGAAGRAGMAVPVIPFGNSMDQGRTTLTAIVHNGGDA